MNTAKDDAKKGVLLFALLYDPNLAALLISAG